VLCPVFPRENAALTMRHRLLIFQLSPVVDRENPLWQDEMGGGLWGNGSVKELVEVAYRFISIMRPQKYSRNPLSSPRVLILVYFRVKLNYFNDQGLDGGGMDGGLKKDGVALACITSGHICTSRRSCPVFLLVSAYQWDSNSDPDSEGENEHPVITLSDIRVGFPLFSASLT